MGQFLLVLAQISGIAFALIGFFCVIGAVSKKSKHKKQQEAASKRAQKDWQENMERTIRQNEIRDVLHRELPHILRKALTETKFFVEHKTQENHKYEKNKVAACYPPYGQPTGVNLRLFELFKPSMVRGNTGDNVASSGACQVSATDTSSSPVVGSDASPRA